MNQPIPLKSENDIKTGFAFTQKFDGIRSLMLINEFWNVFIVKNNLTTIIKTKTIFIFDGELIDDNIYLL